VLASPAETARVVRCSSARRNGLDAPGCEDVIGAAGSGIYPGVALTSFPAATRADLAAAGFSASPATAIAGPFGLSVVIRGNKGTQDTVSGQTGFDATAGMLNLGLDYRFSERSVGGISFSYQHTKLDLDLNSGTLSNDAYRLAPFFSYAVTPTVLVDGLIGIGILDYSSERICSACVVPATDAPQTLVNTASYLGTQWFGSIGIGNLWPLGAWTLHGYARGDFMQLKTDGYTEAGTLISGTSTSAALQVQSQRATSLTSLLGIRASRAISTKAGVLTPAARIEWVHQFADDSRTLYSQFVSVPVPTLMAVTTADPVRDWANVGLSLQMNFARSLVGFVDYMYMYRRDANNHALSLGIRFSF
jgi:outer membrane autotransporter protein